MIFPTIDTEKIKGQRQFFLNMGPQHPSTHGVLRVVLEMDGEYVLDLDPVIGYCHRMHEKMGECRPWPAFLPNTARMDYVCALPYNHGYVSLIEKASGIVPTRRAEFIRVISSELNRVSSHLLWLGAYLLDLGAFTPILYCFDDREQILDILEDVTGSRLTYSYFRVGGVYMDIDEKFVDRTRDFVKRLRGRFSMYEQLVTGNIIFRKRVEENGIISRSMALRYGVTGPTLRGSGISYDIRKKMPYSIYNEFDFNVPTGTNGDSLDRYMVRFLEMEQSLRIIEQALDNLPDGPYMAKVPKKVKIPAGSYSSSVETGRGELSYHLISDGSDIPYRLKVRTPSYCNLSILRELCSGMLLADLVAAIGSLDLVIPEIDR